MSETGFRKYILFWSSAQTSLERTGLGQERKTRQTVAPFNAPSEVHLGSPDSRDSLPDAGDPAKEEKRQEGHRGGRQGTGWRRKSRHAEVQTSNGTATDRSTAQGSLTVCCSMTSAPTKRLLKLTKGARTQRTVARSPSRARI